MTATSGGTPLEVRWYTPLDLAAYVAHILAQESADLDQATIHRSRWVLETAPLGHLHVDEALIERHDQEPIHQRRRDRFVEAMQSGVALPPLIAMLADMVVVNGSSRSIVPTYPAMGSYLYLVDGYARYRALRRFGARSAPVIRQASNDRYSVKDVVDFDD